MGAGLDLMSHSPRCFRMVLMTSRSSMNPMIRMIPPHFGQVRGSTFPDQVEDRLRSSELAGPSSSGIPWSFYPLPGCRGLRRLRFLFAFPGRHCCNTHSTEPSSPLAELACGRRTTQVSRKKIQVLGGGKGSAAVPRERESRSTYPFREGTKEQRIIGKNRARLAGRANHKLTALRFSNKISGM